MAAFPDTQPVREDTVVLTATGKSQHHRHMRWSSLVILSALSTGCFSPEVDTDLEASGTDSSSGGTDATSPTGGQTDGETDPTMGPSESTDSSNPTMGMETESDTMDTTGVPGDDPPVIEAFEANGSATPADVTQSSQIHLSATVTDDNGVSSVAFYDGDTLLGTVTEEPFEFDVLVTSVESGSHAFSAVATDTVEQETTSDEIPLNVSIVGGDVIDTNEGLFEGISSFGIFGGIAQVSENRLVVVGVNAMTEIEAPISSIVTLDENLSQINDTTFPINYPATPRRFEDGVALLPGTLVQEVTTTKNGLVATTAMRYEMFDVNLGAIVPAGALQFPGGNSSAGPCVVESVGNGFALATSPTALTGFEYDLDIELWENDFPVGPSESAAIRASASLPDGSVVVSFDTSDGCLGSATDTCLRRINSDGTTAWTLPTQFAPDRGALVSDDAGGVFYANRVDDGLLVAHLDSNGEELDSAVLTFPNPVTTLAPQVSRDLRGGVVVGLATGQQQNDGSIVGEVGTVMRLDPELAEIWRVNGFAVGSRPVASVVSAEGSVYILGIEATDTPTIFGAVGDVWAARANL